MNGWIDDLRQQLGAGNACVLVTVAGVRGSAPREVGAKMIVTERETIGTIGGGQLEYTCTQIACSSLRKREGGSSWRKFTLGADCGQCCGGIAEILFESFACAQPEWLDPLQAAYRHREPVVIATGAHHKYLITASGECRYPEQAAADESLVSHARRVLEQNRGAERVTTADGDLLLEPITASGLNIAVFGAGHVGTAAVRTLSVLDCNIRWIDSRRNIFPPRVPANVQTIGSARPELEVRAMPPGVFYLVMTHSHPQDLEIVHQVLKRDDYAYCGLIGSVSKRRRFEKQLRKLGVSQSRIDRLICPIGIPGIGGKKPAEIAIAVAAEILRIDRAQSHDEKGVAEAPNVRFLR